MGSMILPARVAESLRGPQQWQANQDVTVDQANKALGGVIQIDPERIQQGVDQGKKAIPKMALQYAKEARDRTKASYDRLKGMYDFLKTYEPPADKPQLKPLIEKAKKQMKELLDARKEVYKGGKEAIKEIEEQMKNGSLSPEKGALLLNQMGAMLNRSANEDEEADRGFMPVMNMLGYTPESGIAEEGKGPVTTTDSEDTGEDVEQGPVTTADSEDTGEDVEEEEL